MTDKRWIENVVINHENWEKEKTGDSLAAHPVSTVEKPPEKKKEVIHA